MKCEKCQGTGMVEGGRVYCLIDLPCGECGGTGEIHCCDGLQEQPAPEYYDGWGGSPQDLDSMPSDGWGGSPQDLDSMPTDSYFNWSGWFPVGSE